MSTPFFQSLDPAGTPPPITPTGGHSDDAGWAKVTPATDSPAPYDISAPQNIAGIAAAVEAAGRLSGGQEGAATGAGWLYPPGPRQAEAAAMMEAAQGTPAGEGSLSVFSGFPDYETAHVDPGGDMENPIQGTGTLPGSTPYPGTTQPGVPQFMAGLGASAGEGLPGVPPESGSMVPSAGGDYPGTLQDGLTKYGTS